jgi:hypothetical protein
VVPARSVSISRLAVSKVLVSVSLLSRCRAIRRSGGAVFLEPLRTLIPADLAETPQRPQRQSAPSAIHPIPDPVVNRLQGSAGPLRLDQAIGRVEGVGQRVGVEQAAAKSRAAKMPYASNR